MAAQDVAGFIITMQIAAGTQNVSVQVPMVDITDGFTAEPALTPGDFDIAYSRPHVAPVKADCVALASPAVDDPHLDNGVFEIDNTNMIGVYRLDIPDAVFAVGEENALVSLTHASCRTVYIHVQLQNQLSAGGLDAITVTEPTTVATTFPGMLVQVWRRFFKKSTLTASTLITYKNDATTPVTTQTVSDLAGTQTQGAAT